jgi:hypothetical protein
MRDLLRFLFILWLTASLLLGALFGLTPVEQVQAGMHAANTSAFCPPALPLPALSPARYTSLRLSLLAAAALGAGGLVLLRRATPSRRPASARLRAEWRQSRRSLLTAWQRLLPAQQAVALLLGAAALGLRGWALVRFPIIDDELTSYDFYVQPGVALTASNYSLPNNHVLHNLLVGGLAKLFSLPPDLLQRLPAALAGAGLLPLSYLLLLRQLRFTAATLALGVFTFLPLPVFYAVAGRGYSLQLAAAVIGFFATLELLQPGGRRRLPEIAFILSAIVGLYAVPTHAGVLVAFGVVLAATYAQQAPRVRWHRLGRLAVATGGIVAIAGLLYAPIGAISGWATLFQNPYVHSSLSWAAFQKDLYSWYLLDIVSRLWGHGHWSVPGLAGLLVLGPLMLVRLRPGLRPLGWLCFAVLFSPFAFLLVQHLYAPPRTLLASALCSFILLALLAQEGLSWWWRPRWLPGARAGQALVVGLVVALYGAYRLRTEAKLVQGLVRYNQDVTRQYRWLCAQRPQRVWLTEGSRVPQGIYWYHQSLLGPARLPLAIADTLPHTATPALTREYVVFNRQQTTEVLPAAFRGRVPAYADAHIYVWRLGPPSSSSR